MCLPLPKMSETDHEYHPNGNKTMKRRYLTNVQITKADDSQNYAALWGMCTKDGAMFYNVSSGPLNELGWSAADWTEFASAIGRVLAGCLAKPATYEKGEDKRLAKLQRWAARNAAIVKANRDAAMIAANVDR